MIKAYYYLLGHIYLSIMEAMSKPKDITEATRFGKVLCLYLDSLDHVDHDRCMTLLYSSIDKCEKALCDHVDILTFEIYLKLLEFAKKYWG